jgi:(2S)-methylsuccinyl-CoA dehydrogenase
LAYDVAHAASAVRTAEAVLAYGAHGETEAAIACAFAADVLADLAGRTVGRSKEWGIAADWMAPAEEFVATFRDPVFLASLADQQGNRHLDTDFELVRETFHRFAEEQIRPRAEHIHRANTDIPEEIISGMAEMGGFGMSVPEEYGGFATGGEADYMGMVVATEELSWGSLGAGGSLITRPEILTRAIVHGGTEEQKRTWLPRLATAEVMGAVAVTEPDFGSDVAGVVTAAVRTEGGWLINGVKTWCTFAARADVLMLLARTDPDRSKAHRGLSLFLIEKRQAEGHGFVFTQDAGADGRPEGSSGRMEGRPIDTLGYRGMHSYEVAFENWFVPEANLVGGDSGLGQGFYLQMQGFENGRLQTAARAIGVMQASYEAALDYARNRVVFGAPIVDYQLTRTKLARMAVLIQSTRQFSYEVARLMSKGEGSLEASMVKAYVCRAAEWVTREALQIHGGMGYAEEFPVSRYFVDARVLSIFEGADETLALKVIARRLLSRTAA